MGTRQIRMSRVAVIALAIGCVLGAPVSAEEGSQLVGVSVDEATAGVTRIQLDVEPMASWSSYRGADGALTLELSHTQPAADLAVPAVAGQAVTSVRVDADPDRGVTLVHVVDHEAEHEIIPSENGLELVFRALNAETETAPTMELSEVVEDEAVEEQVLEEMKVITEAAPEVAIATAAVQPMGTVDAPFEATAEGGVTATEVLAVESTSEAGATSVYIRGDGTFRYSAFSLESPNRFVLDLQGVLIGVADPRIAVDSTAGVKQVRLGQFQDAPQPIARVVFDLDSPVVPWVQPTANGLKIRFGSQPEVIAGMEAPTADDGVMEEVAVAALAVAAVTDAALGTDATLEEMADVVAEAAPLEEATEMDVIDDATGDDRAADFGEEVIEEEVVETLQEEVVEMAEAVDDTLAPELVAEELVAEELVAEEQPEMYAEPVPEPVAAATEAAYLTEQDLTMTTGDAAGEPNRSAGFETREVGGGSRFTGEPIDLSLQDTDVRDVLRSLAQISGLNLVIQPSVSGTVTVEFVQVPWDQALEQILKINNLGYEVEGNIMRVAPLSQLREEAEELQRLAQARAAAVPLTTVLQRISYARANDIARILSAQGGIMSQRGSVVVDARTNTLIIKELPAFIDTVLSVIENLDIAEPQVMIEARIIETTKRFTRTLGVEWGFTGVADAAHGNTTGLEFPNNVQADGGVALLTGGRNGFLDLTLGNVLNTFNLDIALQAAENEGLINVLSEPRVATLNNERATIQSGLQIPIQTVANNTVSVQFVNATLRLDVTPQVTADGTVLMDIRIQKREPQPAFAVPGAANAPIATKEASTRVIVRDGGTTVIGGIYEVSTDHGEDRVPGLGKVKGIGALFRNSRRNDQNEELLIFITPKVIRL